MQTKGKIAQIGLDVHRQFSRATARDEQGGIMWRERVEHQDREALRRQLSGWPRQIPVILEGTFGWGWISDELQAAGLAPHLASSRKVAAWRDARGLAKNNRIDSDLLSELWGQQPRWWEVWLAPPRVREQREWLRYRMSLVHLQTGIKNRIHAVLHRHGILHPFSDLFGTAGRRFLSLLVGPGDQRLPESGRATLRGYLQLLGQIRRRIAAVTKQFRRELVKTPAADRLRTLPGVSWILAYTIMAEVGCIERFQSAKRLAAYSLVAPRADDSGDEEGDTPLGRHVGHAGRRTLKWAWIEAAHGAVLKEGRFREIFNRRTNDGKRDRNRGYIAVGHVLCNTGYVLWKKDVDYTEHPPARPGQRGASETSRPGTGQPEAAMVVAVG